MNSSFIVYLPFLDRFDSNGEKILCFFFGEDRFWYVWTFISVSESVGLLLKVFFSKVVLFEVFKNIECFYSLNLFAMEFDLFLLPLQIISVIFTHTPHKHFFSLNGNRIQVTSVLFSLRLCESFSCRGISTRFTYTHTLTFNGVPINGNGSNGNAPFTCLMG